jgi:pilus assembly protein CpaB
MGKRTLVLIVALVLAGVAGAAVWVFLSSVEEDIKAGQELVPVFKANTAIVEGTSGDLLLSQLGSTPPPIVAGEIAKENRPDNAFGSEQELQAFLTGRVAAGPISNNMVLTRDQWVSETVQVTPLADVIPEGKQAITVAAGGERGVNGFINPGDRINVIVTMAFPAPEEESEETISSAITTTTVPGEEGEPEEPPEITITRFVLQGLRVLAIGQEIRPEGDEPRPVDVTPTEGEEQEERRDIITLEVTSEEAEKLVFSFEEGSVWLTLVPEDFTPLPTEGITRETLFEE